MDTRWLETGDRRGPLIFCVATLLLLQACVTPARAGKLPFPVGVRAGATVASLAFDNLRSGIEESDRVGYFLAGHLDYPIVPWVAIETGLGFADQGGEIAGTLSVFDLEISGSATIQLTYMYIPLLVKFSSPDLRIKPFVKVGPQMGVLLASKLEGTTSETGAVQTDIDDETQGIEGALYFSGGVEFPGTVGSFLEVGYSLGLTGVAEEPNQFFSQVKNRVLVVTAGFLF